MASSSMMASPHCADAATTSSITPVPAGQPVLFADDYGFHYGDVWYRGRWAGRTGAQVSLSAADGPAASI
jgi:hypothetical protein